MGFYAVAGWQPLSDAGVTLPSGTLTFTRTGTSTAKDVYSDKALSNSVTNPVTLDAAGRISTNIFLLNDEGYRVVLKNSSGSTIWTRDEQFGLALAVDESTRRYYVAASPMDHSAAGNGSTNDATALAAVISGAGGCVDLEGKTYRCDSTLALKSGITIRNGTIDFSNAVLSAGLQGAGTAGTPTTVTSATAGGQTIAAAGHSGYTAGDLLRLRSDDTIVTAHKFAELFRVEQTSGDNILVDGAILGTYSTSPKVEEISSISDIRLEDITIIAPSGGYAIELDLCQRVRMRNVQIKCTSAAESLKITSCYGVVLEGCSVIQKTTTEAGGIVIGDASRDVVLRDCHIERALQAIEIGDDFGTYDGLTRDVRIEGCTLAWCGGMVIETGARFVEINNNTIMCDISPSVATTPAIYVSGWNVSIAGNTIRDAEGAAIYIAPTLASNEYIRVYDNKIYGGETHAIQVYYLSTDVAYDRLEICDNEIRGCAGSYVTIAGHTTAVTRIEGNECYDGSGSGVAIDVNSATGFSTNLRIANNTIHGSSSYTHGVRAVAGAASPNVDVVNNHINLGSGSAQIGILITGAGFVGATAAGNTIYKCRTGVSITTTNLCTVRDNVMIMESNAASVGVSVVGSGAAARADVTDNRITGDNAVFAGSGILVDECLTGIISKNRVWCALTGIEVDNTSQEFNGMNICGNDIISTTHHGIEVDASDATGSVGLVVNGNTVNATPGSGEFCIWVTGIITGITIAGNSVIRGNDTDVNIRIAGDAAGNITQCTVADNHLHNGTYGIQVANNATSYHSGNTFSSMSTGNTDGTFAAMIYST